MEPKNQDINCFWLDDRPEAIESIKEQLENRGIKVRIFSNSTQALRAIKNTIESKKNEGDIDDEEVNKFYDPACLIGQMNS